MMEVTGGHGGVGYYGFQDYLTFRGFAGAEYL
jgi:hypothetical protein